MTINEKFEKFISLKYPEVNLQKLNDGTYRNYEAYRLFSVFAAGVICDAYEHSSIVNKSESNEFENRNFISLK